MRTLKQITEELYPDACGDSYCPDDVANEGRTMQISWRMANALHFCLLMCCHYSKAHAESHIMSPDGRRRNTLWHELSYSLIERICKAKKPTLFQDTPIDEYTVFSPLRVSASLRETKPTTIDALFAPYTEQEGEKDGSK